jgi:hypothetical protein
MRKALPALHALIPALLALAVALGAATLTPDGA